MDRWVDVSYCNGAGDFWPPLFATPPKPRSFYHRHHCLPGTGKTDAAVQIMHILYHNCPNQRTLVVTHSNQALNDLFAKVRWWSWCRWCWAWGVRGGAERGWMSAWGVGGG